MHMYVAGIWSNTAKRMLNITVQAENQDAAWAAAKATLKADETLDWVEQID